MPEYIKMNEVLFNKLTDVIEELQLAQQETEKQYIESKVPRLIVIGSKRNDHIPEYKRA